MKLHRFVGLRLFSPSILFLLIACLQMVVTPLKVRADERGTFVDLRAANDTAPPPVHGSLFCEFPRVTLPALEPTSLAAHPIIDSSGELHGSVSITVTEQTTNPCQLIDRLVDAAINRDQQKDSLDAKSKFHDKKWTHLVGRSKEMLEYMTSYQGFESSSEAADVILEEKLKMKNKSAVELVRQKRLDAVHLQLTLAVMEVATGLGLTNLEKRETAIESGVQEMTPLVGSASARQCVQDMIAWSNQIKVPESTFSREPWDVLSQRQKSREMLACSLRNDDVVKAIEARLHKYNHLSNFSRASSKLINTGLSLIAFSPTIASPAAQTAQFIFVACTGGPEEKKLLKEVYLDRRFESRFERLSQESIIAVNNYNSAILTHNPILFECTQIVMEGLSSSEMVASFTGAANAASSASGSPEPLVKSFGERI